MVELGIASPLPLYPRKQRFGANLNSRLRSQRHQQHEALTKLLLTPYFQLIIIWFLLAVLPIGSATLGSLNH